MEFNLNLGDLTSDQKALPLDRDKLYDVIIIGGGPAALTAAVYCMRKGVSTGLVTMNIGGQVAETSIVENYMGYRHIEGIGLVEKFRDHVKQFEIGFSDGVKVKEILDDRNSKIKRVLLEDGSAYRAKALIITTGKSPRRLNVPGEMELVGKGVAYCSICDAPLFAGKRVAVVGGGNSGVESAIDLAKVAEHVTVVQFLDSLTADDILVESMKKFGNVDILLEHEVKSIIGADAVESIVLHNRKDGEERRLNLHGVFIEIGLIPNTDLVKDILSLNKYNEIEVDCACRTSKPGLFAAGDATSVPYKQIIIAAGEGAKAALSACEYILREV